MGVQTVIKNRILVVDPNQDSLDTGWTISGKYAIHTACNPGTIPSRTSLGIVVGKTYIVTYTITDYISGGVKVLFGNISGVTRTSAGTFSEVIQCLGSPVVSFYSDGALSVKNLNFYEQIDASDNSVTITFNEQTNTWGGEKSYKPEFMLKFIDNLFVFKDGVLWMQNSNEIRNNFFGVQYPSRLIFVVNEQYIKDKLWYNIRLDAKGKWSAPSLMTPVTNQFPNGMLSRLKSGNFQLIDGKLWADILNDIHDPNYINDSPVNALFNGRKMQGGILTLEMENNDTKEARIASIEVYYSTVERAL